MGWPGPITHRQFVVWEAWLKEEWDKPNRGDNYLMLVAAWVRRLSENCEVDVDRMKLKFKWKTLAEALPELSPEEKAKQESEFYRQRFLTLAGNTNVAYKTRPKGVQK